MAGQSVLPITNIFEYFSNHPKQLKKGENALRSKHVLSCTYDDDLRVVFGKVQPSMNQEPYDVKVDLGDKGVIIDTQCTCARGRVQCHHAVALLMHVHYNVSITDTACRWVQKKNDSSQKTKVGETFPKKFKGKFVATTEVTEEERGDIYAKFKRKFGLHAGTAWLLYPDVHKSNLRCHKLEATLKSIGLMHADDKAAYLLEHVKITPTEASEIERSTVGQSDNPNWLIARRYLLTASNFNSVLKACNSGRYPPSLFKKLLGSYNLEGVKAVVWGKYNEPEAKKMFEEVFGVKINSCGLFIHESGLIGASPDGLIDDDTLVEIKCPFKFRDSDFEKVLTEKENYILRFKNEVLEINKDHEYYNQIQGQLHIAKRNCCVLIIYNALPSIVTARVYKEEAWSENLDKLQSFYQQNFLPHILTTFQEFEAKQSLSC